MSTDDDRGQHRPRRIIHDRMEFAERAVERYYRERASGSVGRETHLDLVSAALAYRKVLYRYRDDRALSEDWADRGLDWIDDAARGTVTERKAVSSWRGGSTTVQRPRALEIDPEDVVRVIEELDDVASELGFAAASKDTTHDDAASHEDLVGLLQARGQDEAVDRLPNRVTNDLEDNGDD